MNKKPIVLVAATAVTFTLITLFVSFLNPTAFASNQVVLPAASTEIQGLNADETGIHFNLNTPSFQMANSGKNITVAGLDERIANPGAPSLPYYGTYIALPPEAEISIEVLETNRLTGQVRSLEPAADKMLAWDDDGNIIGTPTEIIAEDAAIYGRNTPYPEALYSLSEPMYYRDMRLVALHLYPVRYNPVTSELQQARSLEVRISFNGGRLQDLRPLSAASSQHQADFSGLVLNYEQAQAWRSLPAHLLNTVETALPVGTDTFKIAVNEDGLYDICQADLAAAGMNVASVNPNTLQMLYRGQDVAYQFIGDSDTSFETDECVRFYGTKFEGTRSEKNFITENIYWLWAGGSRTAVASVNNQTRGNIKTTAWYTETKEPELVADFTTADQADWDTFPNEPDLWYWDVIPRSQTSKTYMMTISDPDTAAATNATFLAEFLDRPNNNTFTYSVTAVVNNPATAVTGSWVGHKNVNITGDFPPSYLLNGENTITLTLDLDGNILLNRFTIGYMRHLVAANDQLVFTDETGGTDLQLTGFSTDNALIWDITNPLMPTRISNPTASAGTYTFSLNQAAGTKFIATAQTKSVISLNRYVPPNLNPAGNEADWLAISYGAFLAQANQLAQHRATAQFGNLDTHVVDIKDVINQYGYGLPLPEAIKNYLSYALGNWATAPTYVTLLGDATYNPRRIPCACGYTTLVPTDLIFVDPFLGMVPSDHTMVLLTGNDPLADMTIGRISANTVTEAQTAVNKIIRYDNNFYTTPLLGSSKFLFVADNDDDGGFFCDANIAAATHLPLAISREHMCLGSANYPDTASLRAEMISRINDGLLILNYRGHGSVERWAGGLDPILTNSIEHKTLWLNTNKPTFILSADCLDGFFAFPDRSSMSEAYLMYDNNGALVGSAGMWSSTGLGYDFEHSVLHSGFYDGLFVANGRTVGDAITYSKMNYHALGYQQYELYTFTLQGDPAMLMGFPSDFVYLPVILK